MKKQTFTVRFPEEVLQAIEKIAKKEDRTRGAVIRKLLILGLKLKLKEESHEPDGVLRCSGRETDPGL
jgi:metal-responsive CopG/Arc/MetJ family transcriptional regulator